MKTIFLLLLLSSCSASLCVHEYNQKTQRQRMERYDKQAKKEMIKHRAKHTPKTKKAKTKKKRRYV